jgi:methyl-accepting chemotaxis protein
MTEEQKSTSSLQDEFEALGKNIRNAMQGAWGREERKQLSEEIQKGLNEVGNALGRVADDLQQSEAVQQVSSEIDEFAEQVRSGEVAQKLRAETVDALQALNQELEEWIQRWSGTSDSEESEA